MVLCFLAVSRLESISFSATFFVGPVTAGVVALAALLVIEYRLGDDALSPVEPLSSTIPSVGTLAAMIGGGAFVAFVLLGQRYLTSVLGRKPIGVSVDFLPQVGGVVVAALLLGLLVRTRFLPHLTLAGMTALVGAGIVLAVLGSGGGRTLVLPATALLGFGAGASVSPGLWLAGMSLPVRLVGRTFALVELVRSAGDFVLAPVIGKVASVHGRESAVHGLHVAVWATIALTVAGTVIAAFLWWAGRAGFQRPGLREWQEEVAVALHSPRQFARFRHERPSG